METQIATSTLFKIASLFRPLLANTEFRASLHREIANNRRVKIGISTREQEKEQKATQCLYRCHHHHSQHQ